jgi:hypothetical protein
MDKEHRAAIERLQDISADFLKHYDDLPQDQAADEELYQAVGAVLCLMEPRLGRWRGETLTEAERFEALKRSVDARKAQRYIEDNLSSFGAIVGLEGEELTNAVGNLMIKMQKDLDPKASTG